MSKNSNLHKAKGVKNDEFYTRLEDIEKELSNYRQHFENKIVYCNCDSVPESQFWVYFHTHFAELKLKKLVATHFDRHNFTDKYEYSGGDDADISAYVTIPLNTKTMEAKIGDDVAFKHVLIQQKNSDVH